LLLERKRTGYYKTRNSQEMETYLFFKIPLLAIHEWQMGTNDSFPNEHEWYLPFILSHY
jgi:hypothetical protein